MRVYRASRRPGGGLGNFDPLDASASVARNGWCFNDRKSPILYAAEVEALASLEVAARPGWDSLTELWVAAIELPDASVVDLDTLGIVLPSNWNARPAAPSARAISGEFLAAVDRAATRGHRVCGLRVPSVISSSDHNVLIDPRRAQATAARYRVPGWSRAPFDWLAATAT
ncbi:MAG: RES domain-containing protein [Pseudomonadota bacterium]|nr:RES domain-containing protein [Pseudomonadota bacterium]